MGTSSDSSPSDQNPHGIKSESHVGDLEISKIHTEMCFKTDSRTVTAFSLKSLFTLTKNFANTH